MTAGKTLSISACTFAHLKVQKTVYLTGFVTYKMPQNSAWHVEYMIYMPAILPFYFMCAMLLCLGSQDFSNTYMTFKN